MEFLRNFVATRSLASQRPDWLPLYLRGDLHLAAHLATWIRSRVDSIQPLTFCDEALTNLIVLHDDTSVEVVVRGFAS